MVISRKFGQIYSLKKKCHIIMSVNITEIFEYWKYEKNWGKHAIKIYYGKIQTYVKPF